MSTPRTDIAEFRGARLCPAHGDIVEQGCHDELLAKGGAYADLYNSQFA